MDADEILFGPHEPAPWSPDGADPAPDWEYPREKSHLVSLLYYGERRGPQGASMAVRFDSGREYLYWSVPRDVADSILCAEHPGETHWRLVRTRGYTYLRVR